MRSMYRCQAQEDLAGGIGNLLCSEWDSSSHEGQRFGKLGISGCDWGIWKEEDSIIQIEACCIGDVSHNIISTTQLVKKGLECDSVTWRDVPLPRGQWNAH